MKNIKILFALSPIILYNIIEFAVFLSQKRISFLRKEIKEAQSAHSFIIGSQIQWGHHRRK